MSGKDIDDMTFEKFKFLDSLVTESLSGEENCQHMRRLIRGFAGRTYYIVGNFMHWLILCALCLWITSR